MGLSPGPRSGRKTISVSNTAERLSTISIPCVSVAVRVISGGTVLLGDDALDANGWPILEPIAFDVNDLRKVWVRGTAGAVVAWLILETT